jgi:hypothetical protein
VETMFRGSDGPEGVYLALQDVVSFTSESESGPRGETLIRTHESVSANSVVLRETSSDRRAKALIN